MDPLQGSMGAGRAARPQLHGINTSSLINELRRDTVGSGVTGRNETSAAETAVATEALFIKLQTIQSLQSEITKEHVALEDLNTIFGQSHHRPQGPAAQGQPKSPTLASPTSTSFEASMARDSEQEQEQQVPPSSPPKTGATTEPGKRAAAEAYDRLAAGFQERQKGVDAIMDRLSKLSAAVKEFHTLKPPVLFPDSDTRVLRSAGIVETPVTMSPRPGFT